MVFMTLWLLFPTSADRVVHSPKSSDLPTTVKILAIFKYVLLFISYFL